MLAASFKKIISMSALVNVAYHSHTMRWMLLATGQRLLASAFSTETTRGTTSTTSAYGQVATKRIAVVGTGAVGSYYGGRIWESLRDQPNADVMFHLRNEHYDHCTEHGIDVTSYHGNFSIPAEELLAYSTTDEMAEAVNCLDDHKYFDWVVCSLKSTSLHEVPRLIEPLLSPDTRLLVIMNGLIEDDLIDFMRERRKARGLDGVGCGMALICSNRLSPGKIDHSYGGKLVAGVAYSADANSDRGKWSPSDKEAILDLFSPVTPVPFEFDPNLLRGRWWKNVWNLPFSGISCAMGGITVDKIVNDPSLRRLAYKVIDETIAVANADMLNNGASLEELLGEETRDEMMALSDGMGAYKPSTMLDFHARKPMEVKYLFRRAVDRANDLKVPVPHLETVVDMIEYYQRLYGLF
eukprot:CCRYP_003508-RC/>CCRYP_003508-RC protein AED:0.40 eAED:0.40 QI:64/0.85/0.75/1/1/1/8/1979/409